MLGLSTTSKPTTYPETDGEPMGESGVHVLATLDLLHQLRLQLGDRLGVYLGAKQFVYCVHEEPTQVVCLEPVLPDGAGAIHSELLGLSFEADGELLLARRPDGTPLPHLDRVDARVRELEAEVARLRARLDQG